MQVNLSSKIGILSVFFSVFSLSSTAHAFQNIDRDTYFPGVAQGHKSYNENCPYAQLELNNSAKINETQGASLNYCSSNKGAGLPSNSCDDGRGGYQSCEITGNVAPSLSLGHFQIEQTTRNKVCNTGSKAFKAKKYNRIEIRDTCQVSLSNTGKLIHIASLDLEDKAKLTLTSGDYWIKQISTSGNANIYISGDVRLFVYYDLLLNNDTKITLENNASLTVIGFNDIQLNNNSSLEGDVYANNRLSLNNDSYIKGRISSKKLFMEGDSRINDEVTPPEPPAFPVLSLRLDEDSWDGSYGEVLDSSGNGFNGTTKNSPQPRKDNPALPIDINKMGTCGYGNFNHSQAQYIEVPHNSKLSNEDEITVSAWVNPRSYPHNGRLSTIISKNGNYEFHLNSRGQINWYWELKNTNYPMNLTTSQSIPVNSWSHVIIRYNAHDRNKASIFINGQEVKSIVEDVQPLRHLKENTQPVQVANDYDLSRTFDGLIDEVKIFDQALNDTQIHELYELRHPCPDNVLPTCYEDDFNNTNLSSNWVTSASSGRFIPRIINGRLQLTQATRAQSTASSYQYLYPALGNKIEVEFDYMAYGGNGADGLAIVFSDANITPQAGAFGGPLGYGFKNNSEAVKPGFTGGWLGIGLDEYGNYSKEGGSTNHSSYSTDQSVVLRGSGQNYSGYNYIIGNKVTPDIDNNNGNSKTHRYRITIDSRSNNTANVTVERSVQWKGDSPRFGTIIGPINVLAPQYNQAAVPDNFIMSLTGSTGQLYNTHEIDNFKVCVLYSKPIGEQIDHFEFDHSGEGSTCDVSDVTLRACADESCSTLFTGDVDVTLSTSNLGGDGYWLNSNHITMRNGVANLSIGKPTQGNVTLGVVSSEPSTKPFSDTLCSINGQSLSKNNCSLTFKPEGLTVIVPDKLANKPVYATIKGCGNTFTGTKQIQLWSDYINPNTANIIGSPTVSIVENNGWKTIGKTESSATSVSLNFVNNEARLPLNYSDAGQLQLNVKHTLPQQQIIRGSDTFVSFPLGLSAIVADSNNSTTNSRCPSEDPTCTIFTHAGEEFNLYVRAHAWESNSDTNIANNRVTPNYAQNMLLLDHQLVAPITSSGGNAGNLLVNEYDHAASQGGTHRITQSISEVGVFDISVTPPDNYLGSTAYQIQSASTGSIGRFTPAYFSMSAEQPSITDACGSYTYMGQTFEFDALPTLEITPLSQTGGQLQNYNISNWWKYRNGWDFRTYAATPSNIDVIDADSLSILNRHSGFAKPGNVVKLRNKNQVQLQGAELRYKKPFVPHPPTNDAITLALTDEDLKDTDGICYKLNSSGTCLGYNFPLTPTHRQSGAASLWPTLMALSFHL
jgi:MSHA biogenesis protein MshQ